MSLAAIVRRIVKEQREMIMGPRSIQERARSSGWLRAALALGACTWFLASAAPHANAQDVVRPAYYQLISDALQAYQLRQFERARDLFERAHAVWPNARTLRGLGRVAFDLRHYRAAITYLQRADVSTVQPLDTELRDESARLQAGAERALARVKVQLVPANAQLLVDDKLEPLDQNQRLSLDPGTHDVIIQAPGYVAQQRPYHLYAAERAEWSVQLEPRALPSGATASRAETALPPSFSLRPPQSEREAPASESTRRAWLVPTGLSLTVGGAVLAGIGVDALFSLVDTGALLRREPDSENYSTRWNAAHERALVFAGLSSTVLTVGAAVLADAVPREERRWLTGTLIAVGGLTLATGIALYASDLCGATGDLASCTRQTARRDAGSLMTMLSAPLLTIPVVYAIEWLAQR